MYEIITLNWFWATIIALLGIGVAMALYKIPANEKIDEFAVGFWVNFGIALIAFIFFLATGLIEPLDWPSVALGSLWGFFFIITTLLQMFALRKINVSVMFPITSALSAILTVFAGIALFNEKISFIHWIAIIGIIVSIFIFKITSKKLDEMSKIKLSFVGIAVIIATSSTIGKVVQKFSAVTVDPENFILFQYLSAAFFSLVFGLGYHRNSSFIGQLKSKRVMKTGFMIAFPLFIGGLFIVYALKNGPLSLVYSVMAGYTLISTLVAVKLFNEKVRIQHILFLLIVAMFVALIKIF